jgi:hypothetical protein
MLLGLPTFPADFADPPSMGRVFWIAPRPSEPLIQSED